MLLTKNQHASKDASRRIDHAERPPQICFFMGRAMDQVNRVTVHFSHQAPGRSLPAVHRRHDIPWSERHFACRKCLQSLIHLIRKTGC